MIKPPPKKKRELFFNLPLRTQTEKNTGGHWRVKATRAKTQRGITKAALLAQGGLPELPATITLVRLSQGELDDDNLQSALAHVRDGVADAFGVDDRSKLYTWKYLQERAKEYGVYIKIEAQE